MFKTILKTLAVSATLTLLSACGASDFLRCSGFGLGEKAFDRPSCDSFTGGADLSYYENASIGGPIVNETGTATYNGTFGLQGSKAIGSGGGVQLIVDFDAREISNNDIYNDYAVISGKFTERGVLTGKFSIENDGITPADINGMVGHDAIWATFDNRSETADGYVGGFRAARLAEDYPEEVCSHCTGISPQDIVELQARRLEEEKRLAKEEQARLRNVGPWLAQYKPTTTALQTIAVNVAHTPPPVIKNDPYRQINNADATKAQDTFSVRTGANDTIIMTVNGVDYSLVLSSHGTLEYSIDPKLNLEDYTSLTSSSSWRSADYLNKVTRGIHSTIQGDYVHYTTRTLANSYYDETGDNLGYTTGFATIGIPTLASVVDGQTAVATYSGEAGLSIHQGLFKFFGITMSVDFDANTIAGTGNNIALGVGEKHSGKVVFNSAPIDGNGFEGTFTMNSELRNHLDLIDNPTGQYSGNFFGPNADDLAGVMSFEGTARYFESDHIADVNVIGTGGFRADRQVISR